MSQNLVLHRRCLSNGTIDGTHRLGWDESVDGAIRLRAFAAIATSSRFQRIGVNEGNGPTKR